jgi:hypothetical protein
LKNDEVVALKFDDWPLPNEYLIELGRVGALWAALEFQLNITIGKLAGFDIYDPTGFILITHSSFPQRLDAFAALCDQMVTDQPNLGNFAEVVQQLKSAQRSRNTYMHNTMHYDPASCEVRMSKGTARGKVKVDVERVTVADIRRAAIAVHDAQRALLKLLGGKSAPGAQLRR